MPGYRWTLPRDGAMSKVHSPGREENGSLSRRVMQAGIGAIGAGGTRRQHVVNGWQLAGEDPSLRDGLTGLGNRVRLAQIGDEPPSSHRVLVVIDLDDFKAINDTFGHTTGDRVLQAVADVLRGAARPGDVLLRLGDDEFGAVLRDDDEEAGRELARRFLAALESGVEIDGYAVLVGASVAISGAEAGEPLGAAMRRADASMYHAKSSSNNEKVSVFEPLRDRQVLEDFALASALRGALAR
ncbi:MAG TPA: GGDEF domain-containing protein, partial [Solirubrobacteraceae bacterium]